jgi:hypothetical protein
MGNLPKISFPPLEDVTYSESNVNKESNEINHLKDIALPVDEGMAIKDDE